LLQALQFPGRSAARRLERVHRARAPAPGVSFQPTIFAATVLNRASPGLTSIWK